MNPRRFRPFIVSEPFGLTDLINPCHFLLTATYYHNKVIEKNRDVTYFTGEETNLMNQAAEEIHSEGEKFHE